MVQDFCRQLQEFLTAHGIPDWLVVFIISVCPILECRLGMFTAIVLLEMNPFVGFIISFLGNILPIPFILLLINWIFKVLKKVPAWKAQYVPCLLLPSGRLHQVVCSAGI